MTTPTTSPEPAPSASPPTAYGLEEWTVPGGSGPHDVAPAQDGGVWFTAQHAGQLGWLDPATGETRMIPLGQGSAPHGVIVGPDGAPWITDGGLNAVIRVDPTTFQVERHDLPGDRSRANLNTAVFDSAGVLWFTGQSGIYGRLDPSTGAMEVWDAPGGRGPYGITATPSGEVYYASLAGNHIARLDPGTGEATVIEPPTPNQGARRVWSDSRGRVWVSEWSAGQLAMYDPGDGSWGEWPVPSGERAYAVYVDDLDLVWVSDWGGNQLARFDPATQRFLTIPMPAPGSNVRQIHGRPGEVWLPLSGLDRLAVIRPLSGE